MNNHESFSIRRRFLGAPLVVRIQSIGQDRTVLIFGGYRPHVGSVSIAFAENGSVQCQTASIPGHKDGIVSEQFAKGLCGASGHSVSVSCGIHYDDLSPKDLSALLEILQDMLRETQERFS